MALTDTTVIDIIMKSPHFEGYDLLLYDDGTITDETQRFNLLLDKLQTYLSYVHSGAFQRDNPDSKGLPVRCCIVCKCPPNPAILRIQAIKDRNDPTVKLPVVVVTEAEYLRKEQPSEEKGKAPWWKVW